MTPTVRLVEYIQDVLVMPQGEVNRTGYSHMGATITDTILQAGLNYRTVVAPRIRRLVRRWPSTTTSGFYRNIKRFGLKDVLVWRHEEKLRRIVSLTTFLRDEHVETESDLRLWLGDARNFEALSALPGFGPKTRDYLKMLAGVPAIAVDRHLKAFVSAAGCTETDYHEVRMLIATAAQTLGMPANVLDQAIWSHMSSSRGN